jgi:hypothetical protein
MKFVYFRQSGKQHCRGLLRRTEREFADEI